MSCKLLLLRGRSSKSTAKNFDLCLITYYFCFIDDIYMFIGIKIYLSDILTKADL